MSAVNAIYKLESILDNPKYEGFGTGDLPSLQGKRHRREDFSWDLDPLTGEWVAPQLTKTWQPLHVIGRVRPFNDFPCVVITPAFSQRAIDVLQDVLLPNGELLPLVSDVGSYFLYNCTTIADIIDFEKSKITYMNKYTVLEIDHLEVHRDRLANLTIFTMRKWPKTCFVTDAIARRIRKAKLEGFEFRKIWPLPPDIQYWIHDKHPACQDELTKQPDAETRPIKGNSVVLRLALKYLKPDEEEKLRFEQIADQLDALLVNLEKGAEYYGNLEITEFVRGEARYFFSCPDANELGKKLTPWVKALNWPGNKSLLLRFGEFVDKAAPEKYVQL